MRAVEKVAKKRVSTLSRPSELGPTMRTPAAWHRAISRSCRARPSGPTSAKPAVSTCTQRTPLRMQSLRAASTPATGTATMAWSTGPGMSSTLAKEGRPWIWAPLLLTG